MAVTGRYFQHYHRYFCSYFTVEFLQIQGIRHLWVFGQFYKGSHRPQTFSPRLSFLILRSVHYVNYSYSINIKERKKT